MTLLIASLFAGGWIRSLSRSDRVTIRNYGIAAEFWVSEEGGIGWRKEVYFNLISELGLTDVPLREWGGFKYGMKMVGDSIISKVNVRIVPYWSIVIPLTILSGFLLIPSPRRPCREQKQMEVYKPD